MRVIHFAPAVKQVQRQRNRTTGTGSESPFLRLCRQFEHVTEGERTILGDEPKELIAQMLCDIIEDHDLIPVWLRQRARRKRETPIRDAVNARLRALAAPELPGPAQHP